MAEYMEHSAIFSTFIKLPFVIKTFVMSIFNGRFTQVLLYCSLYIKLKKERNVYNLPTSMSILYQLVLVQ